MIVDIESCEAYLAAPSQCTPGLDRFSYSSGYFQARACRAGTQEDLRLRYTRSPPSEPRNDTVAALG
jgi:hypothetical protein